MTKAYSKSRLAGIPNRFSSIRAKAKNMIAVIIMSLESRVEIDELKAWLKKLPMETLPESKNNEKMPHEITALSTLQIA